MEGLAELHTHLGGSVASDILWSLAHEQGIALPVKDYWEFDRLVTVPDQRGVANLERGALSSSCRPAPRKESGWRSTPTFKVVTADGAPAVPPSFQTVAPLWRPGDTIPRPI